MEPASALELLADVGIGLDALARRRRDLREHDLALVLRILFQEAPEGLELLRQALGVVETVDADDAADRGARLHQAAGALGLGEIRHVDADWGSSPPTRADRTAGCGRPGTMRPYAPLAM